MADMRRRAEREVFWRGVLDRQASSGLTARAFCRQESLQESAFYFWRRTITARDAKQNATASPAFVPVVLAESQAGVMRDCRTSNVHTAGIAIELRGGRTLRLNESIAVDRLAAIVQALEATEARS